ncbi:MAG: UDP-N-acetylmuramoyl-L-alanine--D-glutamate ligase [Pseudomonadota bacterium]
MTEEKPQTLIVGLGKTGLSCARFLAARGVPLAVTDSRDNPPGLAALQQELPDVAVFLGGFDASAFASAQRLVISPGVSLREPLIAQAVARGIEVVGDIELFACHARAPVVAITGSNGKSTVTTLVGEMARQAGRDVRVGGNLGTPVLDLLDATEPDLYVLELSSFQLETTFSLNAVAATVLNLSVDHMDRYQSMDEYAAAKQRIFRGDGVMVLNADDPLVAAMAQAGRHTVRFSLDDGVAYKDFGVMQRMSGLWLTRHDEPLMAADEVRIKGMHNIANALAALALGDAAGLPMPAMLQTLRGFPGLPHRSQWVAEKDGVAWYNDSKGTNVGATLAALQGMPGKVVLIAGGLGKGADFTPLRQAAASKARAVVLIGRDAPLIEQALAGVAPVMHAKDMQDAVAQAHHLAQPGDVVLLSPACASFDMFSGYEERGQIFADAVYKVTA